MGVVVAMTKGANVLELGQRLKAAIADAKTQVPTGVEIDQITDQPRVVEESVSEFLRSFVEALAIVLVVSFISLGWRPGLVVATSVPLVLAVVLLVMNVAGLNLDRITLGSLIIALGLLVDDAIIAVEMMVVKMEQGWSRMQRCGFRLGLDRLPDADRHARNGRRLPAGRHRALDRRRVCRQHLLDRRPRARGVMDCGRVLHALHRRQAAAQLHEAPRGARRRTISTRRASIAPCAASSAGLCATAGWSSR